MGTIGEELKSARQECNLTLEEIAEQTHISLRHLENLENDRLDQLPGGELRWLIMRQYAQRLGLNTEEFYRRYRQISFSESTWKSNAIGNPKRLSIHRPFFRFLFLSLITLVMLILGFLGLWHEFTSRNAEIQDAQTATQMVKPQDLELLSLTTTTLTAGPIMPDSTPNSTIPSGVPQNSSNAATYALNLWIEFQAPCWVSVNVDGRQVTRQEFYRGEKLPFRANNQVSLILGNAGGVRIQINGTPLRRLGAMGEVKRLIFTPDNYREFLEEPTPPVP